jgi:hypothetical protein
MHKMKVSCKDKFLPYSILEHIVKETDIPKLTIEEDQSELIMDTLHGNGKIIFKNNNVYEGDLKYGILESKNAKIYFEKDGITYEGEITNNQINGKGTYTFSKSNSM